MRGGFVITEIFSCSLVFDTSAPYFCCQKLSVFSLRLVMKVSITRCQEGLRPPVK